MSRYSILSLSIILAFVAAPAYASTLSFSPTTVQVTKGQTFTVAVTVNSAGTKVYTVKADVSYPAALLEATGFSFASGWMPLSAAGYDSTDNTAGKLVKTGGFPGGFTDTKTLGTITFIAKDNGTATVSASNASIAYDAQNKNTVSGTQGSASVVIGAAATPAPKAATAPTAGQPAAASAPGTVSAIGTTPTPSTAGEVPEVAEATSVPATTSVAAAGVASGQIAKLAAYWWVILLALLAAILGFFGYRFYRRRSMY